MIPYLLQTEDISPVEERVFDAVCKGVRAIPTQPPFRDITCHEVALAVAQTLPAYLYYVRGCFLGPAWEHGWVEFQGRPVRSRLVIDVYPWAAAGGPLLVSVQPRTPWGQAYVSMGDSPPKRGCRLEAIRHIINAIDRGIRGSI